MQFKITLLNSVFKNKYLKRFTSLAFLFFVFVGADGQRLTPDGTGSTIKFTIKNFGFATTGNFSGLKGSIMFDASNSSHSSFAVSINAASVNTNNQLRDKHLRKEEYFDVEKYPLINFISSAISQTTPGNFLMQAKLTIKGVTKDISFPFTASAQKNGYLFAGSFKINRRDFGVGGSSMVLADNLDVSLSIFAK